MRSVQITSKSAALTVLSCGLVSGLVGCQGAMFLGNFAVLAVTFGIFMGTLSLGRDR